MSMRMAIGVGRLRVLLGAPAVAFPRPSEFNEPGDVDTGIDRIVAAQNGAAVGELEAQVAHGLRVEHGRERAGECVVLRVAAAARAGVGPAQVAERVAGLAVIGERVSHHERVPRRELVVQLGGGLGLGARRREETVAHGTAAEDAVDGAHQRWSEIGVFERAVVFLLEGGVVERAVLDHRTAERHAGAVLVQHRRHRFGFEWAAGVQRSIFNEQKGIAVQGVGARSGDDIDGTSRGSAGFGREAGVHHLELLHRFERKLGTAGSEVFVIVVQAVDRHVVAACAEAAECEAAIQQRGERLLARLCGGRRDAWREQREIQVIAALHGQLLDTERIEELPVESRNYLNFALLAPGVSASATQPGKQALAALLDSGFTFGGLRARSNNVTIDGLDNNDEYLGASRTELSLETVQEFQVVNAGLSAETGGASGGSINVITRTGANT